MITIDVIIAIISTVPLIIITITTAVSIIIIVDVVVVVIVVVVVDTGNFLGGKIPATYVSRSKFDGESENNVGKMRSRLFNALCYHFITCQDYHFITCQ